MRRKKNLVIIIVLVVTLMSIIFVPKLIRYIEVRQEWNKELSLIKDPLLYSHKHDRFVYIVGIDSYDKDSINWHFTIREPVFDKLYDKYNFITDSGRFRAPKSHGYNFQTSRFVPTKQSQISKKISYEEFIEEYGFALGLLDRSGDTSYIYIWDNRYIFMPYNRREFGDGKLYDLKTKKEIYALNNETYNYDVVVDNSINGDILPEIIMTKDGALISVYKKYNNLYLRLLN